MNFIPAQESNLFIKGFRIFVKGLFKLRFKKVWIHQEYTPSGDDRTVYFLNHTSWWDGLIPFLLNEFRFKQKGRAMMEYKQMQTYPFFKRLGAFSTMPENRSHTLSSMRFAVKSMQRPKASLYIYPQGEIVPAGSAITFQPGLSWLKKQLPTIDFVPIGISLHTIRTSKPELHIWIGQPVETKEQDPSKLTQAFEDVMKNTLSKLRTTAGFSDHKYEHFV